MAAPGLPVLGGDKLPVGYKPVRRNGVLRGLAKYGGGRLDEKLISLVKQGRLSIPKEDIDTFQRIANVETGGLVQALNTWDSTAVSIGFMQWTLQHGKVQEWIGLVPGAFQRFGIEADAGRKYKWTVKGKVTSEHTAIKGAANKNELRWNGWAQRFYRAGLDDEIIVAEAGLAQKHLQRHLNGLKNALKNASLYNTFMGHYGNSLQIRGVFQAAYNNRPAAAKAGTIAALKSAGAVSTEKFLKVLQDSILQAYVDQDDNGSRIVSETRTGARSA
mgnify:CR=1 FL=1